MNHALLLRFHTNKYVSGDISTHAKPFGMWYEKPEEPPCVRLGRSLL